MPTTKHRDRRPYFNVPPSEQPLRVRATRRAEPKPVDQPDKPLEQLLIGHLFHPLDDALSLHDQDRQAMRDANEECQHGRLPGDRTPPCGCWVQEPAPERPTVPDLIPAWVLADAVQLRASGMTWRKLARAILPVTDCADLPSCEQLLKLRLEAQELAGSAEERD